TLIIINQLPAFLGIPRPATSNTIAIVTALVSGLDQVNPYVMATGLAAAAVLLAARRLQKRTRFPLPGPLLAIIIPALMVYFAGWHEQGVRIVSDLSPLSEVGLRFHLP